jgi:molecular chaperone GrpE (heat shock protein)
MSERSAPKISKWPFFLGDALLLATAGWLVVHNPHPLEVWLQVLVITCVVGAAWLGSWPFVEEYRATVKFAESNELASTVAKIDDLETVADHIRAATGQWQGVQEHAGKTIASAREIADRMTSEAKSFQDFMQRTNDTEKAHLRLEVEKLRRGEGEWLQLVVHLLDHVHALHRAGSRSGQPNVIEQLTQFQNACRDVVRRTGVGLLDALPGQPFDPKVHQTLDGSEPPDGSIIVDGLAPGVSYQGQLVRRCLVQLQAIDTTVSANPLAEATSSLTASTAPPTPPDSSSELDFGTQAS